MTEINKTYKLFLDDLRNVEAIYHDIDGFIVVRNYDDFIKCIQERGLTVQAGSFCKKTLCKHEHRVHYWFRSKACLHKCKP